MSIKTDLARGGRTLLASVALVALAACGTLYESAKRSDASGTAFQQALHNGYVELAKLEASEGDWADADHFGGKALASIDDTVAPDTPASRMLPEDTTGAINTAYSRLTSALERGAGDVIPQRAADAQTAFDCWIQEQEENFQPDDIARCRAAFEAAIADVEAALAPKAVDHDAITIYFGLDSTGFDAEAKAMIEKAIAYAGDSKRVLVTGHTDRSGSASYNAGLADRRANAVLDALTTGGVPGKIVSANSFGESRPAVMTADGVAKRANRRVVIRFRTR
ncbi:MAG: OmpA family protein [Alphaproteobacteria bacterium]